MNSKIYICINKIQNTIHLIFDSTMWIFKKHNSRSQYPNIFFLNRKYNISTIKLASKTLMILKRQTSFLLEILFYFTFYLFFLFFYNAHNR